MININRKGLMFIFLRRYGCMDGDIDTTTVCSVMWHLFIGCVVIFCIVGAATLFSVILLEPLALIVMYCITDYYNSTYPTFFFSIDSQPLLPFSLAFYVIAILVGLVCLYNHIIDKLNARAEKRYNDMDLNDRLKARTEKEKRKPNLALQLIRGCYTRFKHKVCVVVNIDD